MQGQKMYWRLLSDDRTIHEVRHDDESQPVKYAQQDRSFDSGKIQFINYDSVKFVMFTKLESIIS